MPLHHGPWPYEPIAPGRPVVQGSRFMISSGHYLASAVGLRVLQSGGNAVDAGVAAGLAINVIQTDMTSLGGVAPIMIYLAESGEVLTISGLGCWPQAATIEAVIRVGNGGPNHGIARTVVPAAVDAWLTALARYGTMTLAEVAAPAIELAERGFPMYAHMRNDLQKYVAMWFDDLPSCRDHFLPHGRLPAIGEPFTQPDLGRTLRRLVEAEGGASYLGRADAIMAARDRFYQGDIADEIAHFYDQQGGLLTKEDLSGFSVAIEAPVKSSYRGYEVYACGPWCQGPMVPAALNMLEGYDLAALGQNSPDSLQLIVESLKLAFADRHRFYGDPRFVDVPIDGLLDKAYAAERRGLIDLDRAWPEMPPAGDPWRFVNGGRHSVIGGVGAPVVAGRQEPDTSYVCVVDEQGNAFSATPSDAPSSPIIPGLGLIASSRGYQAWIDPEHPSCIAPGKRPRLTPSPGLVLKDGRLVMPFGTPGNDRQPQAMVQFLSNLFDHGLNLQQAVEAPRLASYSFPSTGHPHVYEPGKLRLEQSFPAGVITELAARGHQVEASGDHSFEGFGSVCAILVDHEHGTLLGAADPRRTAYALGW
jgi:gamma-glutamyltranspeptidase / glutathione hydrolase